MTIPVSFLSEEAWYYRVGLTGLEGSRKGREGGRKGREEGSRREGGGK